MRKFNYCQEMNQEIADNERIEEIYLFILLGLAVLTWVILLVSERVPFWIGVIAISAIIWIYIIVKALQD